MKSALVVIFISILLVSNVFAKTSDSILAGSKKCPQSKTLSWESESIDCNYDEDAFCNQPECSSYASKDLDVNVTFGLCSCVQLKQD